MRRRMIISLVLIAFLFQAIALPAFASSVSIAGGISQKSDNLFVPEMLVTAYNESLDTVFTAMGMEKSTVLQVQAFAKLSYDNTEDGKVHYTNASKTIDLLITAPDRYLPGDLVSLLIDMNSSRNPLLNLPEFAFVFAIGLLDSTCDFSALTLWVNGATDGDVYESPGFQASSTSKKDVISGILLRKTA